VVFLRFEVSLVRRFQLPDFEALERCFGFNAESVKALLSRAAQVDGSQPQQAVDAFIK